MSVLVDKHLADFLYKADELGDKLIKPDAIDLRVEGLFVKDGESWKECNLENGKYRLESDVPYRVRFAEKIDVLPNLDYDICARSTSCRIGLRVGTVYQVPSDSCYTQFEADIMSMFFPIVLHKGKSRISQLVIKQGRHLDTDSLMRNNYMSVLSKDGGEDALYEHLGEDDNVIFRINPTTALESKRNDTAIDIEMDKHYALTDYWNVLQFKDNEIEMKKGRMYLFNVGPKVRMVDSCGLLYAYGKSGLEAELMEPSLVDVGFEGELSCPTWSTGKQTVRGGQKIAQLAIYGLSGEPIRKYGAPSLKSGYQNEMSPNPGRMFYY